MYFPYYSLYFTFYSLLLSLYSLYFTCYSLCIPLLRPELVRPAAIGDLFGIYKGSHWDQFIGIYRVDKWITLRAQLNKYVHTIIKGPFTADLCYK